MKKTTQLLVRNLKTRGNPTLTLDVDPDDTVYSVMEQIEDATGFPPIVQMITSSRGEGSSFQVKVFFYDTPGTVADILFYDTAGTGTVADDMVSSPDGGIPPPSVTVTHSGLTWTRLRAKTLWSLGFLPIVDDDGGEEELDLSSELGEKKMRIAVTDYVRTARGEVDKPMVLVVEAGDTVASLKEQVRRRRRYPVAMQEITVCDADSPSAADHKAARRMDRLDGTLADYNVKSDSLIRLYMSNAFAVQVDREARGKVFNKANKTGTNVYNVVFCLFTGAVVIAFIAMLINFILS